MMSVENPTFGSLSAPDAVSGEMVLLRTAVGEKTAELCARYYAASLRAVVLTGSLARDEATWVREAMGWRLLGDAEFLLVFEQRVALPPQLALNSLAQEIQCALGREGILGHVQLAPVHPKYLRGVRPHIFAYELRACGRVVWGEPDILSLIPSFTAAEIPLEDAWRLLANRTIEHLEAAARIRTCTEGLTERLGYCTVKLYLDMATSLGIFAGFYAPTYNERRLRLSILAEKPEAAGNWPVPVQAFAEQVNVATDLKLEGGALQTAALGWDFWRQAVRYSKLLWQWELERLAGVKELAPDLDLMRHWRGLQPFGPKLRGWMFVWRACGWLRSWRWWLRWARLAAGGSPRYWVYSSAYSLFCQLPEVLEVSSDGVGTGQHMRGEDVLGSLPVVRRAQGSKNSLGWADLVGEVAWNYHRLLEPTRA